ncbi:MAG: hypothetical protein AB1327_09685 [Bacillota bacterium]|uniref:hypothetical protein n=1 Tax=Desulforudis sp. DRI-14 TaxID=3459793 RepID=UPI00349009EE
MQIQSLTEFENTVQKEWLGSTVKVTKADAALAIEMRLNDARVIDWEDVEDGIKEKYPRDSKFFVFSGKSIRPNALMDRDTPCAVVVHVDGETTYDVRPHRLVIVSDEEVVQVSQVH